MARTGRLIIPHEDPNPAVLEAPTPVHFPKEAGLTWTNFHPEPNRNKPLQPDSTPTLEWRRVAEEIEDLRARFIKRNPRGFESACSNIDRSAVIAVYNEARLKLEHVSDIDAIKIHLETKTKVCTILDLRKAAPDDMVFYTKDAFLSPLEPHYAQPRLDYYDRGIGDGDDSYYWTGIERLKEWRKDGWPNVYPEKAVEREIRERQRRKGMTTTQIHVEMFRARVEDSPDRGEEVNADSERPWR